MAKIVPASRCTDGGNPCRQSACEPCGKPAANRNAGKPVRRPFGPAELVEHGVGPYPRRRQRSTGDLVLRFAITVTYFQAARLREFRLSLARRQSRSRRV